MLPDLDALASFALVVALLTITPGVDTAIVLRAGATGDRARAWGVVLGVQLGVLTWGALAALGVSAVLAASQLAYDVVRYAGAAYLVWIGARLLWGAVRGRAHDAPAEGTRRTGMLAGLRRGAVTNLLNPKVGAFYVALLPQLIPVGAPHLTWGLALAGTHVLLGALWLGALVLLARSVRGWLQRPLVARWVDGVAGTAIAGFGVRLAVVR